MPETDPMNFGSATPVFRVASVEASVDYYTRALGFKVDFQLPAFASVSRGRCAVFLCEGDQGHFGTWVWIPVADAQAACDELRARGATIRHPPANYPWGSLEAHVEDLDGNVLRLGSDEVKGQPIGEWLDMYGQRWRMTSPGHWTRVAET